MSTPLCPSCGGPMVVGDRIAEPDVRFVMPFPAPPELVLTRMVEEAHAVWICPSPGCPEQALQRLS